MFEQDCTFQSGTLPLEHGQPVMIPHSRYLATSRRTMLQTWLHTMRPWQLAATHINGHKLPRLTAMPATLSFWPFDSSFDRLIHPMLFAQTGRIVAFYLSVPPRSAPSVWRWGWKMFEAKVLQLFEELTATFTDSKWEAEETRGNLRAFTAAMDACKFAKMLGWQSQEPENKLEVFASNILDILEPWHILAFDNLQMISILALFIFIYLILSSEGNGHLRCCSLNRYLNKSCQTCLPSVLWSQTVLWLDDGCRFFASWRAWENWRLK